MVLYNINYDFFNDLPILILNSVAHILITFAENAGSYIQLLIVGLIFGAILMGAYFVLKMGLGPVYHYIKKIVNLGVD